jgi:hypothetical protein
MIIDHVAPEATGFFVEPAVYDLHFLHTDSPVLAM